MRHPAKGHAALRRGRHSLGEATYFLTICTDGKAPGLDAEAVRRGLLEQAKDISLGWALRAMTVMPDHVHLIAELARGNDLFSAVRLFKGRSSVLMRAHGLRWQRGYYDHRVRNNEDLLPVFLYVFLNPYRALLLRSDQAWPGYYCAAEDWEWFRELTRESCPFPEWLS